MPDTNVRQCSQDRTLGSVAVVLLRGNMKLHPMKMLKSGLNSFPLSGPCCHPVTPVLNAGAPGVRVRLGAGRGRAGLSYPLGARRDCPLVPSALPFGEAGVFRDNVYVYF